MTTIEPAKQVALIYYATEVEANGARRVLWDVEPDKNPETIGWSELDEAGDWPVPGKPVRTVLAECEITTDIIPEHKRPSFNDGLTEYEPGQEWHRLKRFVSIAFGVNASPLMEAPSKSEPSDHHDKG